MFTTLASSMMHRTPNAVMHRYPGSSLAVWRTELAPGATGSEHVIDVEQVVVVVDGLLCTKVDGDVRTLQPGDSAAIAAGAVRQLTNPHSAAVVTLTAAMPGVTARVGAADRVVVPWSA